MGYVQKMGARKEAALFVLPLAVGIDRILDMGRTVVNITGDAVCTMVVSNLESKAEQARQEPAAA